jgi:ataxia telangiectasia mutated family protein
VRLLLSCRETLFGVLGENAVLLDSMRVRTGTVRHMEVEALVTSSDISRKHGALQESLASVTYLSDLVQPCKAFGLDIEATAQHEVATVLWDQGEAETSIRMRQYLREHADFDSQTTDISLPVLLAKLVSNYFPLQSGPMLMQLRDITLRKLA